MRAYSGVKEVKSEAKKCDLVVKRRKLHLLSSFFVLLVTFSCMGLTISNTSIAAEVRQITSYWTPNLTDLGKLKFVSEEQTEMEVLSSVGEMSMPFASVFVDEVDEGIFEVNGLGSMVVHACLKGEVSKIENDEGVKTIILSHGKNLKTCYAGINTLGVKKGDKVEKNTPLGICSSSKIIFTVLYKDKVLAGLSVKDGEFTFL